MTWMEPEIYDMVFIFISVAQEIVERITPLQRVEIREFQQNTASCSCNTTWDFIVKKFSTCHLLSVLNKNLSHNSVFSSDSSTILLRCVVSCSSFGHFPALVMLICAPAKGHDMKNKAEICKQVDKVQSSACIQHTK